MSAPFFSKFNLTPEEKDATIAVIGLGTLFPGRPGVAGFWSVIKNGLDTMSDIPLEHFNAADYYDPDPKARDKIYTKRGAFISKVPFEPLRYGISPKDIDSIDTTQLLGLLVADAALTDAGYPVDKSDHSRTAVIVGVTGALKMTVTLGSRLAHPQLKKALLESGVDDNTAREVLERFANQFTPWRELSFPGLLGNVTAGRIASRLNLGGANMVVDAACASSLAAVSQAILELRAKRADLVVSGGMDTFNDPFMFTCFSKTPALSRTGEVKSFDEAGDGTMLGEGLGVVILQRLADAERDNNRIYAVIRGVGAASDGRGTAIFAPSAQGQKRALEAAFKEAGFGADTIELVEAHGTGTAVGDAIELSALSSLFGENKLGYPWCALGSVKSQIGHTKAAAGIAGLIKVVLSLHHKVLPPTIKVKNPLAPLKEENCPFYLNTEARPWFARGQHPRRAVVSAFGFGGANYHAILEEAGEIKIPFETGVHLLPFSASRLESIVQDIRDLAQDAWLSVPQESLGQERVAQDYFSQAVDYHFRSHPSFDKDAPEKLFLAFPAQRARDFLNTLVDQLSAHFQNRDMVSLPDGIFFGRNKEEELVYYIPGSFSLEPGTAKELALNFSHFQMILDLFSEGYEGTPLGLLLYPPELSLNSLKEKWLSELHSPLGSYFLKTALSIALYELYSFFGITSKRTMGRGPGLLAALVIAGYLPLKEVIIALGKLAPSDIEGLKEALNSLPIEDPPPGKPQLVNTNGEPWESLALIKSALMADFEELLNNPEAFLQASPDGLASGLIIYAGSPVSLEAGELSLNSKVRVLPAPKGTLDFAKNLAYLASIGQPVAFRNWSYFTFPPPKPDGHHVLLSGANTYTPEPSPQVRVHKATEVSGELEKRVDRLAKAQEESLEEMRAIREFLTENLSFAPGAQGERPLGGPGKKTIKASFLSSFSDLRARVPGGNGSGAQKKPSLAGDPQGLDSIKAPFDPLSSQGAFHVLAEIVAKETGYPPESLNPSLDLESDLGLDSIKKVELFSEIAHHFPDMAISNFSSSRTLGDLAGKLISPPQHLTSNSFNDYSSQNPLETKAPGSHSVLGRGQKASQTSFSGFYGKPKASTIIVQTIAKETGYPEATLNPELNLEEDLGLDSIRKVEIFSSISETLPLLEPKDLARATTIGDLFKLADQMETTGPPLPSAPSYAEYFEKPTMDPQALSAGSQIPVGSNSPALKATRTFGSFKATGPSSLASNSAYPLTIEILARETGYPPGSLDPSMDLESDLGLDSIRKVEILSLISEEHGISPSQDQTRLAQARRLSDWLSFFHKDYVDSSSPIAKERGGNPKSYPQPESPKASSSLIQNALDASIKASSQNEMRASNISEFGSPSSYFHEKALMPPAPSEDPEPLIDPDELPKVFSVIASPYTLDSQEIDLKEYSPIVILGSNTLSRSIASHFEDKGLEVSRYPWQEDFTQDSIVPASLILVWPGPDSDPSLITQALKTIQVLGSKLKAIVGITFLGGYFGCPRPEGGGSPIGNSASAALAGLIKCAALEWPGVLARVIDLPLATYEVLFPSMEGNIYQSLFVPGPVEVGLPTGDKIIRSALAPYPLSLSPGSSLPLNEGDTVVATGGARGITARILLELAKHVRLRFVILGRTPPGPREPAWLMVHNTEQEIQMALHKASDGNLAPKELSLRAKLTLNSRELNANIAALEKLGSEVEYLSGNWLDPTWAQASARKLKQAFGPIKGFIHGAGILRDHSILGKDPHDFARVFDTKAQLAQVLLEVFRDEPLSLILFMSSTTARFGRKGQADYAAANEVLNKMAWEENRTRGSAVVKSLGWGPWNGGMVSSALKELFKSESIGLIDLDLGAKSAVKLLSDSPGGPAELLILGQGTDLSLLKPYLNREDGL